jgi:APA family basic amino acid/polyamine antiporter
LIGWDLILEFTLGAATVAKGWSGYFVSVFELIGITVPAALVPNEDGAGADFLAVAVIAAMTVILVIGIKLSSQFNQIIIAIKILVTIFIIGFGVWFIDAANLSRSSRHRLRAGTPTAAPSTPTCCRASSG